MKTAFKLKVRDALVTAAIALCLLSALLARGNAQGVATPIDAVPLGYCQLSASQLGSSVGLASCVRASFTGSGSGTVLTVTSVTGIIKGGDAVSGSGVPAGTVIVAQITGTTGVAGTYRTSVATTSSSASLTSGGIPASATSAYIVSEVASVRYRDDGGAPTTGTGNLVVFGAGGGVLYNGTLSALRFIGASGSPLLNVAFYR